MSPAAVQQVDRSSRVAAIDGLRGLLAVVVLAWHVCSRVGVGWMLMPANVAVCLFFLLSGFVLTLGWDGRFGVFLIRRFVRLWPVYAVCLGTGYLIAGVHPVWSEFLWYPSVGPNTEPAIDPPIWSLFVEARAMLFMPLVVWAGSAGPIRMLLCVLVCLALCLVSPFFFFLAIFVFGAFMASPNWRNRFLESPVPQWLGKVSYSLYLSHFLVLELAARPFGPWGAVVAVPVAFAVAWLLWWSVERPSIRASRRVGRAAGDFLADLHRRVGAIAPPA